jgi:L-2-hydroxyglutarate oxidase
LPLLDRGIMKIGKGPKENEKVREMYESALQSGVEAELLESEEEIHEFEPHISGETALYSSESATVDTVAITKHLANVAWENSVEFLMGWEVTGIERNGTGVTVETNKRAIDANYIVNAAGAKATRFGKALGYGQEYQAVPFRGLYYELVPEKRPLVNSNVYPTGIGPSFQVGVHFTRRPDNRVIVGPTGMIALGSETYGKTEFNLPEIVETLKSSNFRKFIGNSQNLRLAWDELNKTYRKKTFLNRCQKLIPSLQRDDLVEGYVGISHWLFDRAGNRVNDPVIEFGDESAHLLLSQPGFTSALPIADHIADAVLSRVS